MEVLLFQRVDLGQVGDSNSHVTKNGATDFDIKLFLLGDLLGLHGIHGSVNAIVFGALNAADRYSIVHASMVDGCRQ